MKNRNLILILFFCYLIVSCNKVYEENQNKLQNKIDTLLAKANNDFYNKQDRLMYTDSVSNYIQKIKSDSLFKYYNFKLANRYYNLQLLENYKNTTVEIYNKAKKENESS